MRTLYIAGAAALAFVATSALPVMEAAAKPVSMCFKTGNGKNYIAVDTKNGYLVANAKSCTGNAVFSIDYYNMNPKAPVRVGVPVVIKAANGRYVQFYGSRLRATAPKIRVRDRRFLYLMRPSHGRIKTGQPLASKMRLNLYPMITSLRMMTTATKGGGRDIRNVRRQKSSNPAAYFTLTSAAKTTAKTKADPKMVAALQRKLAAIKAAMARYRDYAKRYLHQASVLEKQAKSAKQRANGLIKQEKKIAGLYKQTQAQLKKAMGK